MQVSNILHYKNKYPTIGKNVFIAHNACVIGDVVIGDFSSIWFYTLIRGDVNFIRIGSKTNIQDHCTLHVTTEKFPLHIGNMVTIGHRAVVHGCTIDDECLIGMGAIIMDGAHIEKHSIVAGGSVVTPGMKVKSGTLVAGIPAKVKRNLETKEIENIINTAKHYVKIASNYK